MPGRQRSGCMAADKVPAQHGMTETNTGYWSRDLSAHSLANGRGR